MTLKQKRSAPYSCDVALEEFNSLTETPEAFLAFSQDNALIERVKHSLKRSYDYAKLHEPPSKKSNALPELIVDNFDLEQIWQQIELQNEEVLDKNVIHISKVLANRNMLFKEIEIPEEVHSEENAKEEEVEKNVEDEENDDDDDEEQIDLSENEQTAENGDEESKRKQRKSVVDDDFFKLDEMEQFLKQQETDSLPKKTPKPNDDSDSEDSEASVDLFKEVASDDEENDKLKNPRYKDFFRVTNNEEEARPKRNKFFEEHDGEEEDNEFKSSLELREERLKRKIEDLEEQALSEKPWQLKGEITADKRPQNSLLEEVVDFELTRRPAPVITEQTNLQLEDIIKQRIKDKVFDSVVKKVRPVDTPLEYKKKLVLDQEKSKLSLAQIYENEYLQQKEALDPNAAAEKEEEEPQLHKDINTMMNSLFAKLDALSNFHYTPKPIAPELKIVVNTPAINMEEVAPIAASDAAVLAPEEIKNKPKGDPISKHERSETDKKRERRKKKLKQKIHAEAKKKRELEGGGGLGNKYSNIKMKKAVEKAVKEKNVDRLEESGGGKRVKSSSAFFTQLQEEVQSQIKAKKVEKKRNKQIDIKKIKL